MNKRQHLYGGLLSGIVIVLMSYYYGKPLFSFIDSLIFIIVIPFMTLIPDIDTEIGKHRGAFHNVFFAILVAVLIYHIGSITILIAWFVAYTSHIILDLFTKRGIMLFYPLSKSSIGGFGVDAKSVSGTIVSDVVSILYGLGLVYVYVVIL